MTDILCVSRNIGIIGNYLYFVTDKGSLVGRIDVKTGETVFMQNTPEAISGRNSDGDFTVVMDNKMYILIDGGSRIVEFDTDAQKFELFESQANIFISGGYGGYAGSYIYANKIFAFARENGVVIVYDLDRKRFEQINTGISSKIMWICGNDDNVYILSWDYRTLYFLNLTTWRLNSQKINLDKADKVNKTVIPTHFMNCDDKYIYISDAQNVFKFDIRTRKIMLLYKNKEADNGTRMVITENIIIIPPREQSAFRLIDKETGKVLKDIKIHDDVVFGTEWKGNKTGDLSENDKDIFFPIIGSNTVLRIDKELLNHTWITLKFDELSLKRAIRNIPKGTAITENSLLSLDRFLNEMVKGE